MLPGMSPAVQKAISLAAGLAALVFLVYAELVGWVLSPTLAGMVGSIAGAGMAILVPAPGHSEKLVEVLREGTRALAAQREPKAADSTEVLR